MVQIASSSGRHTCKSCLSQQRESRAHSHTSMDKYAVCALVFALGAFVQFHPVFTQDSPKIHPKPGECSRRALLAPSKRGCVSDQDCPGDHKCCVFDCEDVCVAPSFNKPGVCPDTTGQLGYCAFLCFDDRDCSDELKCCRNGCAGYNCMPPFQVKPGRCPLHQGTCAENCFHDGQCAGDQKCCQTACGLACSQPL
uniref:WAP four-disulfide core domain 2 n=2 Tax=Hippocampus comes TaxID=109280 RepID=A0A3Q2ZAD5_HIPCM